MSQPAKPSQTFIDYFPSLTSPLGMVFYSFFIYLFILIIWRLKQKYVVPTIFNSVNNGIKKSMEENRARRGEEAKKLLEKIQ